MGDLYEESISIFDEKTNVSNYEVKLCESLPEKLRCALCHFIMRNPVQTSRGLLACEDCYKEALYDSGICPIDGEPIGSDEYHTDNFIKNQINILKCFCINKAFGCSWKGIIRELKEHYVCCKHAPTKCCLCEEEVDKSTLNSHLEDCPKLSLNGKCIYPECPFKPVNIGDLENHLKKGVIYHAMLHSSAMKNMQMEFNIKLEMQQKCSTDKQETLEKKMKELMYQFSSFMKQTKETNEDNKRRISILQERVNEFENKPVSSTGSSQLVEISGKVHTLTQTLSELNLRQQLYENITYDGKILWKIDNITSRMKQAVTGNVIALHSAPAFTSKYGYKFCGRVYLNGHGVGIGTHISMFFILMKSEYDGLLTWPFNKRITMRLIDQNENEGDVVEFFDANVTSSSFAKPKKDMNVASGCPLFVTKEKLLSGCFIKDDAIFIELSVS